MVGEAMVNAIFTVGTKYKPHADTALRGAAGKIRNMLERDIITKFPESDGCEPRRRRSLRPAQERGFRLVPGRPSFETHPLIP